MERNTKIAISAAASLLATGVAFGVSFLSAGIGHGSYLPFAGLFPFAFLASIPEKGIGAVAGTLALAQFPVYGFFIGRGWLRGAVRSVGARVLIAHAAAAIISVIIFMT